MYTINSYCCKSTISSSAVPLYKNSSRQGCSRNPGEEWFVGQGEYEIWWVVVCSSGVNKYANVSPRAHNSPVIVFTNISPMGINFPPIE